MTNRTMTVTERRAQKLAHGFTHLELRVLALVAHGGVPTFSVGGNRPFYIGSVFAAHVGVPPNTLSRTLRTLTRSGWFRYTPVKDAKPWLCDVTIRRDARDDVRTALDTPKGRAARMALRLMGMTMTLGT
jgi:DNA-binding MarR family transcriptional regulator